MEGVQQKQQYLRTEILQAGYDPQNFIAFMHEETDGQTVNIGELTFRQLQRLVIKYKQTYQPSNQSQPQEQQPNQTRFSATKSDIQAHEIISTSQAKRTKIQYEKYSPLFDYQFHSFINCVESHKLINTQKLIIEIPDFETKETQGFIFGIGSRTQYYYHIKTNLMKGTIKRLSEDFDWLNNSINRLYPFLALPQLETIRKDISSPYKRRMKDIQEYLRHLAEKQYILTSQLFIDFLTISSEKMEKYKKSYDSMTFTKEVSMIKSLQGKLQVQLTSNSISYFKQSKQFTKKITAIHDKLSQGIAKMIQSFQAAVQESYSVVSGFAQLHEAYRSLTNKYPAYKQQNYNDMLVGMNNLFLGIGDSLQGIKKRLEKYGKEYFRFTSGYDKNLHKVQKLVKESHNEYLDFKYNLWRKKERVISDPSKWQLEKNVLDPTQMSKEELKEAILPKETLIEMELKCWYAYNLKNYQQQFHDYLSSSSKRYAEVFKEMCKDLLVGDKNYLESLTNFIEECRKF